MGLFSKIKNILFEEEEIEVPVKEVKKAEKIDEEVLDNREEEKIEKAKQVVNQTETASLFEKEPTFNFPDFDEDEFENTLPKYKEEVEETKETRTSKLYSEHQRELKVDKEEPKRKEDTYKKNEVRSIGRGLSLFDKGPSEKETKKKFTPSPIISPVYGILDKDYNPEDISSRDGDNVIKRNSKLDVDSVRKKAFEPKEEKKDEIKEETKKELKEEVKELPKEEPKKEEPKEEIKEIKDEEIKKSVDELINESAEEAEIVDEDLNVETNIKEIEDELDKIDDELILDEKPKEKDEDDTLEQDLFELIDSMYEDKKEDED